MILNAPISRKAGTRLGLPALVGVLAWCGFVLSGAAVADDPEPQSDDSTSRIVIKDGYIITEENDGAGGKTVTVKVMDEDGNVLLEEAENTTVDLTVEEEEDGEHKYIFVHKEAEGAAGLMHRLHKRIRLGHGHGLLKRFGVGGHGHGMNWPEIPSVADMDADGEVSRAERAAYLTALAMSDPKAVLTQFEWADGNEDGVLSVEEAVRLFAAPTRLHVIKEVTGEDEESEEQVRIVVKCQRGAEDDEDVFVWHGDGEADLPQMPCPWVLENISAELTTEDVAEYLEAVGDLPDVAHKCKMLLKEIDPADEDSAGAGKRMDVWVSSAGEGEADQIELETLVGEESKNVLILRHGEEGELNIQVIAEEEEVDEDLLEEVEEH